MQNKNSTKFYCRNKIEKGYKKKTYPRPMLNKLKVAINFTLFITIGHLAQRIFSRNFRFTCCPCVNCK